jgi:hypothetical protein
MMLKWRSLPQLMQRYWIVPSLVAVLLMTLHQPIRADDSASFSAVPSPAVRHQSGEMEATLAAAKSPDKKTQLKQMILLWLLASQPGK